MPTKSHINTLSMPIIYALIEYFNKKGFNIRNIEHLIYLYNDDKVFTVTNFMDFMLELNNKYQDETSDIKAVLKKFYKTLLF